MAAMLIIGFILLGILLLANLLDMANFDGSYKKNR